MNNRKIGTVVLDKISNTVATISAISWAQGDGPKFRVYHLDGVPDDTNYPGGRRIDSEISTSRVAINSINSTEGN